MNFGILLVQSLVNSFGTIVMAAFAAGVKIDTLAYSPLMDFGNAFSTAIAQNYGAGDQKRIKECVIASAKMVVSFALLTSIIIYAFAPELMAFFVPRAATETIAIGAGYLRIEGACYIGIGILSMLYAYYRAIKEPGMSVILTILSRKPRHSCLCPLLPPLLRRHRHLALHPYRLGYRRCVWGVERDAGKMTGPSVSSACGLPMPSRYAPHLLSL